MNKERMLKLAEFFDELPRKKFNMGSWAARHKDGASHTIDPSTLDLNECGTTACIAGWAIYLFEDRDIPHALGPYSERAAALLDINEHQANFLFYGGFNSNPTLLITPPDAARGLRAMAAREVKEFA